MELQGILTYRSETQQITEKFSKRDFVIKTDEQYPQEIKFELHQDKTDLIDPYSDGELIKVEFNLRGRSYTNKDGVTQYANTLQAWRIQK
jgi:single-strand DNA-binding protein